MREITRVAIVGVAAALAGCPSSGSSGGAGTLTVSWNTQNIDGSAASCPSGYGTMRVSAAGFQTEFADFPSTSETPTVTTFDCAAGTGVIDLPGGDDYNGIYHVWFEVTDSTGAAVIMKDTHFGSGYDSNKYRVDLSSGAATLAIDMYPNAGHLWLEWSFEGIMLGDNLYSCEAAGVDRLVIALEDEAMVTSSLTYPCAGENGRDGIKLLGTRAVGGALEPVAPSYYTMRATAYSGSTVVGMSASDEGARVMDRNQITSTATGFVMRLTNR